MEIKPLAFDSFSTRSMATLVTTKDASIAIDPGIAIGPYRYGLEPSRLELETLKQDRKKIIKELKNSKESLKKLTAVTIISHYHFDHHPHYSDEEFNNAAYKGRVVFAKNPKDKINLSQKNRSKVFESIAKPIANELRYSDNKEANVGKTTISFSEPVFHGSSSRLGYVVMCTVTEGNRAVMHCSDIQGPVAKETADLIIKEDPSFIIIGGPPTYFLGYRFSTKDLEQAMNNVIRIMDKTRAKTIILDHHLLRDIKYREHFARAYESAEGLGVKLMTAAEYLGVENKQLEARRKELVKNQ